MATQENKKTSIQMALRGDFYTLDRDSELQTRLKKLFTTLEGDERTKAVIESIQRHAVERLDFAFDSDFDEIDTNSLESIRTIIQEKLTDVDSATPQLVGILERITVVLEKLQHPTPNNDVNALAAMLEKAAIAMQPPPEQKAITGETEENTDVRGEHRLASSPTRTDEAD